MLEVTEIMKVLPHRAPFLLVDRVIEMDPGKRIVGIKNVAMNEPWFVGHFPGRPIMPGVLIVEALAQTGGILMYHTKEEFRGKLMYFAAIENVRFRKPVVPGDTLTLIVEFTAVRQRLIKMSGKAMVGNDVAAEGDMSAFVADEAFTPA